MRPVQGGTQKLTMNSQENDYQQKLRQAQAQADSHVENIEPRIFRCDAKRSRVCGFCGMARNNMRWQRVNSNTLFNMVGFDTGAMSW